MHQSARLKKTRPPAVAQNGSSAMKEELVYDVPGYVWIVIVVYAVAMATLPGVALASGGARQAGLSTAALLGSAMVVSGLAAWSGVYRQHDEGSMVWIGVPLAGLLVALVLAARLPAVQKGLRYPQSLPWLALPQTFRIGGVVFVLLWLRGDLPAVFGVLAGFGDIAVSVLGMLLVWRARHGAVDRSGFFWFNVFGLADLVVAATVGVTSLPGVLHLLQVAPTTEAMTLLPLALVPSVGVPVMATLHLVSLRIINEPFAYAEIAPAR